jgi:tRNA dimethylallyltransferase
LNSSCYFICAPTATGKSSLAIRLAKKIGGKIVNADSMQVYSNLKILTARPSKADNEIVDHLLYGYVNGSERYNVAKWCRDISNIIYKHQKNSTPLVIVGGTGMYIQSLINGIIDMPIIDEKFKKKSHAVLEKIGLDNFIKEIMIYDPESLKNISFNDNSRIRRVWEVYNSTGTSLSHWKKKHNKKYVSDFNYKILLFKPLREKIYQNINFRFKKMLNNGAIDEVQNLLNLNLDTSLPIMRAHGVPEISNYLNKKYTLEECINMGQQVTRNYAKRQLSWWRGSTLTIDQVFDEFPDDFDENLIKI